MNLTLARIAELVGGRLDRDGETPISGIAGIEEAQASDLTFLANERYLPLLSKTRAGGVLVAETLAASSPAPTIRVADPNLAFARVAELLHRARTLPPKGIHPTAVVSPQARIAQEVAIGAGTVVEEGAEIGDGTILFPQVYVGPHVKIGPHCILHPRVVVCEGCVLGARVQLHPGAVVGSDGFGFATVNGRHQRIPQTGIVVLEDDVEVGANSTIDRARFDRTVIGRGTKIDNLVQIGHNVRIGENGLFAAQAGICGSATLGNNVIMAGQSAVIGHLRIADGTVIMGQSAACKDTRTAGAYMGTPAEDRMAYWRRQALLRRLPDLAEEVRRLRRELDDLRSKG